MDKIFVLEKKHFVLDKIISSRTNLILSRTKKYFVWADGQGISFNWYLLMGSKHLCNTTSKMPHFYFIETFKKPMTKLY